MKRPVALIIMLMFLTALKAATPAEEKAAYGENDWKQYVPQLGGALRTQYEFDTEYGAGRFDVRNARLRVTGKVISGIGYFMQADFCLRGKFSMLDAYISVRPNTEWTMMIGQSRVPFSVDATRAPGNYLFVNRSFIGRYIGNQRSVGVKAAYSSRSVPFYIEGGFFNAASIGDHNVWLKHYTFGVKARYTLADCITPEIGYKSDVPQGGFRTGFLSTTLTYNLDRVFVEGEYVWQHYNHDRFSDCHAFNLMGRYTVPVGWGMFSRFSTEARYDGMTDHSSGIPDATGRLICDDIRRQRVTVGMTLSAWRGIAHFDLRVNYEQYFYPATYTPPLGTANKVVGEIVLYF